LGSLLIPVRDVERRIVALQVRPDDPGSGGKYQYLSSKRKGGVGPGNPVHVPLFDGDKTTIRITEGTLKADVATFLSSILTIGLPGVNSWRRVPKFVRQLGASIIRLAYDADASKNLHVAQSLSQLANHLRDEGGLVVELEVWDLADGKGIDDLFAAGKSPRVLSGDSVFPGIEEIDKEARAKSRQVAAESGQVRNGHASIAHASNGCLDGPDLFRRNEENKHEDEDDPHRLAANFLKKNHRHAQGVRLRFWADVFCSYDGACYQKLTDDEIRAQLVQSIKEDFDLAAELKRAGPPREDGKSTKRKESLQ